MLRIKLVKSTIANTPRNRATVAALGLGKMGSEVTQNDTPVIRGMIHKVKHLLEVTEVEGTVAQRGPKKGQAAAKSKKATAGKTAKAAAEPKAAKRAPAKKKAEEAN